MKGGTCTTSPVSVLAGLVTLEAVALFNPGSVSTTVNSTVWGQFANEYPAWPSSAVLESDPLSKGAGEQLNSGNGPIASNTAATPGSVGFSNTGEAASASNGGFTNGATASTHGTGGGTSASHQILWAEIQNNGTGAVGTYTDPLLTGSQIANCETTKLIPSDKGFPYSYTDSWSGVVASYVTLKAKMLSFPFICFSES